MIPNRRLGRQDGGVDRKIQSRALHRRPDAPPRTTHWSRRRDHAGGQGRRWKMDSAIHGLRPLVKSPAEGEENARAWVNTRPVGERG